MEGGVFSREFSMGGENSFYRDRKVVCILPIKLFRSLALRTESAEVEPDSLLSILAFQEQIPQLCCTL